MKIERVKAALKVFSVCLFSSVFAVCLFALTKWALVQSALAIVSVSILFSVVAIFLSIANFILFAAKLFSTHSVQILDINSKTLATPVQKKGSPKPSVATKEEPLYPEEDEIEVSASRKAAELTSQLFGSPKERYDDSIL